MNQTIEKPRLNSREVECIIRLHKNETVPQELRMNLLQLLGKEMVCAGDRGWVLTLSGKKIARHLTGVA